METAKATSEQENSSSIIFSLSVHVGPIPGRGSAWRWAQTQGEVGSLSKTASCLAQWLKKLRRSFQLANTALKEEAPHQAPRSCPLE